MALQFSDFSGTRAILISVFEQLHVRSYRVLGRFADFRLNVTDCGRILDHRGGNAWPSTTAVKSVHSFRVC